MSETIRVRRANVILDIAPEEKKQYMANGFSVIEVGTGKVLEEALSHDYRTLHLQIMTLRQEIEALKAENANLAKQLEDAKKKSVQVKKETKAK